MVSKFNVDQTDSHEAREIRTPFPSLGSQQLEFRGLPLHSNLPIWEPL